MESLGSFIKKHRIFNKLSQRRLSEQLQISNTELSNIEKDIRKKVDPLLLKKLSNSLNINYDELLILAGYKIDSNNQLIDTRDKYTFKSRTNYIDTIKKIAFEKVFTEMKNDINFVEVEYSDKNTVPLHPYALATTNGKNRYGFSVYYYNNTYSKFLKTDLSNQHLEEKIKSEFVNFYFKSINDGLTNENIKFVAIVIINDTKLLSELKSFLDSKIYFIQPVLSYRIVNSNKLI